MKRSFVLFVLTILTSPSFTACGGDSSTDNPTGVDYFPLAKGVQWVYNETDHATNAILGVTTKTITSQKAVNGKNTWIQETTQTNTQTFKYSYLFDDGQVVTRLKQELYQNADKSMIDYRMYDPGFIRLDRTLLKTGDTRQETHVIEEYDPNGKKLSSKTKQYTWIVEAVDAKVTVPAGTFTCLVIKRVENGGDYKRFSYAADVGKVKEEGVDENEELKSYTIPEPTKPE